uniref:Uncharacterized protein n=1 Tax=Oryza punctata TaxID=4537 RepID=A0A0E0M8V9_ORYPU
MSIKGADARWLSGRDRWIKPRQLADGAESPNWRVAQATSELASAEKVVQTDELVKKHTAQRNLRGEVDQHMKNNLAQFQHFQRELDATKGLREELVQSLVPTLNLLFSSRCEGKDPF